MPVKIDIIILSYAKNEALKGLTIQAIDTLLASENPNEIIFNILVIESDKTLAPYQYPGSNTIYPDVDFGYNRYMNIGIEASNNEYVCLCNNDLVFHKNWASELLKVFNDNPEVVSANPYCDNFNYDIKIVNNQNIIRRDKNLDVNGILTGWCIFVRRGIFNTIGALDEQFTFWYADNDYDCTLRKHNLIHVLVKSSVVTHLANQSHNLLLDREYEQTIGQREIFERKWNNRSLLKKIIRFIKSK